ncbi:MAG: preprotein translocase subunit SecG, partial [Lutibacter sp.]|nr:preprotein translocase subunit SecG [Lutibacter sp.]
MMTYTLFLVLIMIVAFLLILIIMVQNPKGGGLSSSFGGGGTQALGGVQNTTNFLDKSTWTLSMVLLALILLSNFVAPTKNSIDTSSEIENT